MNTTITAILPSGLYLIPLLVLNGELESSVHTYIRVGDEDKITIPEAHALAAHLYHSGNPESSSIGIPTFESICGYLVHPKNNIHDMPLDVSHMPQDIQNALNSNIYDVSSYLSLCRDKIDQFLKLHDE